jgi:hypothetical protein
MADELFDFFSGGGDSPAPSGDPGSSGLFDFPTSGAGSDSGDRLQTSMPSGGGDTDWSKFIPAAITGGTGLMGLFRDQGGATDKALKAQGKATQPMQAAGNQALNAYTSGKLTQPQQAAVDQFRKQAMAKWQQYFASAGIPVSSAQADIENKVNMDTQAYANQLLQQDFQNSVAATGMSVNNLTNLARMQALQDAEQRKAFQDFMAQLGKLGGDIFGGNSGVIWD